jgi:hypothetical protein
MSRSTSSATAFSMGDLLFTLAVKEKDEGQQGGTVVGELMRLYRCVCMCVCVRVCECV